MCMRKFTRFCLALLVAAAGRTADAQSVTGQVQGVVRAADSGLPIQGANVVVVGSRFGATTQADGRYTVSGVPAGSNQVRATRIGYSPKEQAVTVVAGQAAAAEFSLSLSALSLDQVVVTGYGTQTRRDVTGSVSSVTSTDITTMPVPRVDEAISGLVSGVQVQTTNAQPGSELRIRVRGGNSLQGSNEPLVVVDGVIGADLNQIDPNDIDAVDVLKDASSTAIYGARAANGVIQVTTKRGQSGSMRFDYSGYTGMQSVSKHIDLLSAREFALMFMRNPNHDKSVTFDTLNLESLQTTDWQDVVYRQAPMQNHEIRLSGSNGGTNVMASASLFQQDGIVMNSNFDRGSVRFNLDQELNPRVRAGTRLTYSHSVQKATRVNEGYGSAGGPVTMMALRFAPTIPVYAADGSFSAPLL